MSTAIVENVNISNVCTRNEVRMRAVNLFSGETPGTGTGSAASKYTYYVENLSDGKRIYLTRPAALNNGFDFVIKVENMVFNPRGRGVQVEAPKHTNLFEDLRQKKLNYPDFYLQLYGSIDLIFNCQADVGDCPENLKNLCWGMPSDMILGIAKWFFIEQDIRYWNNSGRNMLMSGIPQP